MGLYIDEASRKRQIRNAQRKAHEAATKIGQCFHKILNPLAKKSTEAELTRLFLEGVSEFVLYTSINRELNEEEGKADLAAFIKREYAKYSQQAASKRPH